jgi:hypothetical protein
MTPLEAARLANRAYTDKPTFGKADGSGRAVVYDRAVAFPGTDNVATFLADLDTLARRVQGLGLVHCGFMDAWQEVAPQVLALPSVDIVIGHSLGAAMAILCAANLCLAGKPPKVLYAFEAPRASQDDAIAKILKANGVDVHIYRTGMDVVTDVPRLLGNWQHAVPLTAIGKAKHPFPNVEDHMMVNVIAALA